MAISEIEAIKVVDDIMSQLDEATRNRVLRWAWEKYSSKPLPEKEIEVYRTGAKPKEKTAKKNSTNKKSKAKSGPTIVKDLNLRPKGKKSFTDFIVEKKPKDNQQKCTVAVYYLKHELGLTTITVNHVYTCYKNANWRVPNIENVLRITAFRRGWVDTSNMMNIGIPTHGENLVEHDLPPKAKSTEK